jgi:multidrug efflux system membrane fusion protein
MNTHRRLPTLMLVALASAALPACSRDGAAAPAGAGGAKISLARKFPVTVTTATTERLVYHIDAIGGIEAEEWVQVAAEVEGVLGEVRFKEGDAVDPSRSLVEIDPERYALALSSKEAAVQRCEADLTEKESALAKRRELRAKNQTWVTEEEITHYEAQVAQARAALAEAKAARDLARRDLDRARVRPPIEGVIEKRDAVSGQYVRPGTVLATILKTRPVRLRFSLREEESAKVKPGDKVSFTVPAYADEKFEAEIFFVSRSADPVSRRVDILARNANDDGRLKPGYFARVTIDVGSRDDAVLLPEAAVLATEDGFVAYVARDGKARRKLLEIGLQAKDGRIEVRRGIEPGEQVIVRGAGYVSDGVSIDIQQAEPAAAPSSGGSAPAAAEAARS